MSGIDWNGLTRRVALGGATPTGRYDFYSLDVPAPPAADAPRLHRLRWCVTVIDPDPEAHDALRLAAALLVRVIDGEGGEADRCAADRLFDEVCRLYRGGQLLFQAYSRGDAMSDARSSEA